MQKAIKEAIERISNNNKKIKLVSHFDTDGICSAAIFSRALQRANKKFSLEIVKSLEEDFIKKLPEDQILIFADLASNSLNYLKDKKTEIFIFDHHEISQNIPENVTLINPLLYNEEILCSAAISYLFAKELSEKNIDLANLAVIGMVGDMHENNLGKKYKQILADAEVTPKKGLLLYPATRPLDRVLENSFSLYIPGVTGSFKGVLEILKEANISKTQQGFKSISELSNEEMSNLATAIMLRKHNIQDSKIIGHLYLIKFLNHIEDAREISAMINACSRMDFPYLSLGLCLSNKEIKKEAEKIYAKYKKTISSALEILPQLEKVESDNFVIINAKDSIKDTIIGTIASIISHSQTYKEGTIIIGMAYREDKIKISARLSARVGKNVLHVLKKATSNLKVEVGGHPQAAGCLINKENETQFIENVKKELSLEVIKPNLIKVNKDNL